MVICLLSNTLYTIIQGLASGQCSEIDLKRNNPPPGEGVGCSLACLAALSSGRLQVSDLLGVPPEAVEHSLVLRQLGVASQTGLRRPDRADDVLDGADGELDDLEFCRWPVAGPHQSRVATRRCQLV